MNETAKRNMKETEPLKIIELKINELENITGGSEPPRYLTPEGEARAKKMKEQYLQTLKLEKNQPYEETSPGSGLLKYREINPRDQHPGWP